MKRRTFIFDPTRCFGCQGCVAACARINGTPPGVLWRTVHKLCPEDGDSKTLYISLACNHCANAPCAAACPSRAMAIREDGVVVHDASRCLGCRYCQMACPFDAIRWDETGSVVGKCHHCADRLDAGSLPACVETCFGDALRSAAMSEEESASLVNELEFFPDNAWAAPSIRFVSTGDKENP